MEAIMDEDRRRRLRNLEEKIVDPRSVTNVDCLLVSFALASVAVHKSIKRHSLLLSRVSVQIVKCVTFTSLRMKPFLPGIEILFL